MEKSIEQILETCAAEMQSARDAIGKMVSDSKGKGIEWPELKGEYKGSASAEGYTLEDGTTLNLSDKDQKWLGLKDTFKF